MLESNQMIVGRSDENTIRRKEACPELRAHSTSIGVEDKFTERLQNLEEKLSGPSLRMDISTRMEQTMAGLIDKLAALEKRLEERASSKVVSPEVSRERPMRIDERQSSERRSEGTKPYRSEGATKPRAVTCFSCGEPGHVSTDCPMQRRKTYGGEQLSKPNAQERSRGDTFYRCGKPGHFGRYCPENNGTKRNEKGGGSGGFSAMKLACEVKDDAGMHHVYLTMKLDGVNREFLLDSGCDMTLLPSHFVRTHEMRKSDKKVHAANGAEIVVMGEVTVELRFGNLCIRTDALVSEFVTEAMLGYDWLVDNDCYWGFRTGQVMIRDQVFPLQKQSLSHKCCRVVAQSRVIIPRRSEAIISARATFNEASQGKDDTLIEYTTVPERLTNGLYIARAIVPHQCEDVPVRVLNVSNRPIIIRQGRTVAKLEPATIGASGGGVSSNDEVETQDWKKELMAGVAEEIGEANRSELIA